MARKIKPRARRSSRLNQQTAISRRYGNFEKAYAAMLAVPSAKKAGDCYELAFNCALGKCDTILRQIIQMPASNTNDMLLKVRIVGWCTDVAFVGNRPFRSDIHKLEDLDQWRPCADRSYGFEGLTALTSIREDLRRFQTMAREIIGPDTTSSRGQK